MKAKIIVLVEDRAPNTFVRSFLGECGYDSRQITTAPLPGRAGGSGEAYVRKRFLQELKAMRSRQETALIVVIDGDKIDVAGRIGQLQRECSEAGIEWRSANESVVVAVPMRNIETWFVYLLDEGDWTAEADEWKRKKDGLAKPAGKALHRMCFRDQKLRQPAPGSLARACEEWKRMRN